MSLNVNIPEIAITPEAEEDDDSYFMNLAEALTDVEELYDENISLRKNSFKKKLKIKVVDNDGYNTALEDVEASDDEETTIIKPHSCPIELENLDIEQFSAEENYGITKQETDKFRYLNLQSSRSKDMQNRRLSDSGLAVAMTDIEDYDTENEVEEEIELPDIDIHLDSGESTQTVKISDELQQPNTLLGEACAADCVTPHTSTHFPISLFEENTTSYLPRKKPPTFSQIMRGRAKCAENKTRRKRRNKIDIRKSYDTKESGGSESSDTEKVEPRNRNMLISVNTQNYESDNEEEIKLPFPLCKKTFKKKKNLLQMPEFDTNNITDVEDVECDVDITRKRLSVDGNVFQRQLDEMASCYSFTKDKNEARDEADDEIDNVKAKINVKQEKVKSLKKPAVSNLSIPVPDEGGHTDVENLASSSEDNASDVNVKENSSSDTEEECFKVNFSMNSVELPEIPLPPASRSLILAEESKSLIPTVRILPLEDIYTDSEVEVQETDDEIFNSDRESEDFNEITLTQTPHVLQFDGGSISVSENCIHSTHKRQTIDEVATDIEDLDAENQKQKKGKKTKKSKYLMPDPSKINVLTDVEDLEMSDAKSGISLLSLPYSEIDGCTDVENLDTTDDERNLPKSSENIRRISLPVLLLPDHTDTEDVVKTDEKVDLSMPEESTLNELQNELDYASSINVNIENSTKIDYSPEEVMYLKGGGFQEVQTDTEYLLDAFSPVQEVMEAWEYFNQTGTMSSNEEWHAPAEAAISESNEPFTVKEEIEGDTTPKTSGSQDTSAVKDEPRASSSDKQEEQIRSQPFDQHQLSDEMKELLKEMEKTNIQ